jgi:hypothetical protein
VLAAATASVGHPAVAALLGLGTAGLGGAVVAMVWNVHVRQIRLAELVARRSMPVITEVPATETLPANGNGYGNGNGNGNGKEYATPRQNGTTRARPAEPAAIDGPETVITGEQARYRIRPSGNQQVVSWAVGGGSVSQSADPARPDELLLVADRPGNLTVAVRLREGLTERRETKAVTAVPDETAAAPPATSRLAAHMWGLVVVAVLIVGFAGALAALGNLSSADFIALVAPLAALLAVIAVVRGSADAPPGSGQGKPGPRPLRQRVSGEETPHDLVRVGQGRGPSQQNGQ